MTDDRKADVTLVNSRYQPTKAELELHVQVLPDSADPGISHNRHVSNGFGVLRQTRISYPSTSLVLCVFADIFSTDLLRAFSK